MQKSSIHRGLKDIKIVLIILFYLFWNSSLLSQSFNLGTPLVQNFSPEVYDLGTQSWDLDIADNGTLYIANNNGLVRFDGEKWETYAQPNSTIGRSLAIENGRIYFGGQDELGFWERNKQGKLCYENILPLIPEDQRDLEDIWQIKTAASTTVFRNRNSVRAIYKEAYKPIAMGITSNFLSKIENTFYYNDFYKGIYALSPSLEKRFLKGSELLIEKAVIDMLLLKDNSFLILTENGLYRYQNQVFSPWESNANAYLKQAQIVSGCVLQNGMIAIGTRLGGLVIMDADGKAIYKLDKKTGLQSNSITRIVEDTWGNLWLASYYGIDKVNLSASLNFFYPDESLEGAVFDIELWENKWWFGTTNGLYSLPYQDYYNPFEEKSFQYIAGSSGQVWSMDIVDNQLYLGHNNGAFQVYADGRLDKIGDFIGGWKFIGLTPSKMAIGTYDGMQIFKKENAKWISDYKIKDFNESARIIVKDKDNNLWISHPYRGVFKIAFDAFFEEYSIEKYPPKSGFQAQHKNYVFSVFDTPYITNDTGIYRYHFDKDSFVQDSLLTNLLAVSGTVQRIINKNKMLWYITDQETGFLESKKVGFTDKYSLNRFPNLSKLYVAGFENLYPKDESHQFLCTNRGVLYHYIQDQPNKYPLKASIDYIKLTKTDSLIYIDPSRSKLSLAAHENALEFNFRTNGKTNSELLGYSYKLEGLEQEWATYASKAFKEYTNLDHGTYTFLLKAKDKNQQESSIYKIAIEIQAPWYATNIAKVIYGLFILFSIIALLLIPRKKHEKTTALLVNKQRETEQEMEKIKQEKLSNEIQFKNQELASSTLHLLQKNQTLTSVRTEIDALRKQVKDSKLRKELNNIIAILRSDLRLEEDWDRFSMHFDQVHSNFIKKLKTTYPELSTKDHKLCAYLKMNLTTKEIAPLLNISVRGVEISRYRLRRKLKLEKSVNLNDFMNSI